MHASHSIAAFSAAHETANMMRRWMVWLLCFAAAPAASFACPPSLHDDPQVFVQARSGELWGRFRYAMARVLKCEWDEARPAVASAMDALRVHGSKSALATVYQFGEMTPHDAVDLFRRHSDPSGAPELASLQLRDDERDAAAQRFEDAIPKVVALAAERAGGELPRPHSTFAGLLLVAHDVRTGALDDARARLERIAAVPVDVDQPDLRAIRQSRRMREALEPMSPLPAAERWVLERNVYVETCGTAVTADSALDPAALRAGLLVKAGDTNGALAVLLRNEWQFTRTDGTSQARRLRELLTERYSPERIRQAWRDAEASVNVAGDMPSFRLFDVELALPYVVRDYDPNGSGVTIERQPERDEVIAHMRSSSLFTALFPDGQPGN